MKRTGVIIATLAALAGCHAGDEQNPKGQPAKVEGMQRPGASEHAPLFAAPYQNSQERMRAGGPGGRWRKIRRGAGGKHPARFPALVGAIGRPEHHGPRLVGTARPVYRISNLV